MNNDINIIFVAASPLKGEMTLGTNILNNSILGYLKSKSINLYKNIKNVFKDKRKRLLIITISIIWLVLILIKSLNINFFLTDIINYLTFSTGGTGGGVITIIGGLIGKSILAYFISTLILQNKNNLNVINYIKNFIKTFNLKEKSFIIFSVIGIGLSLILYNFITGDASMNNSVIGIVSILLLLKALYGKTGMMKETLHLFLNKTGIMKESESNNLNSVVTGCIIGFVLGIIISLIGKNLCYIIGFIVLIVGIVANFTMKKI